MLSHISHLIIIALLYFINLPLIPFTFSATRPIQNSHIFYLILIILIYAVTRPLLNGNVANSRINSAGITFNSSSEAPFYVECPTELFLRNPYEAEAKISEAEMNYIDEKAKKSISQWEKYLEQAQLEDFKVKEFLKRPRKDGGSAGVTLPNLAFSLSGGGVRALHYGGSLFNAFDERNVNSTAARVGGILQLANYVASVSGGTWLLGYWATSNFPLIERSRWRLGQLDSLRSWAIPTDYKKIYTRLQEKKKAGFPTCIVDVWGGGLGRHFVNSTSSDALAKGRVLWSSIRETEAYKSRTAPFIIALATSRPDKKTEFSLDSPTYEFTPVEFGVWHPYLNVSIPIDYLGSPPESLESPRSFKCVKAFDRADFVLGMSSNIFTAADARNPPPPFKVVNNFFSEDSWEGKVPNTFKGLGQSTGSNNQTFQDCQRDVLLIADSGFINENLPIIPFLQPSRKVDMIIAGDSSADGHNPKDPEQYSYPNGTALFTLYSKTLQPHFSGYRMPKIPNPYDGTFERLGFNKRPIVFGCESGPETPLILYLPNYYVVGKTNVETKKVLYSSEMVEDFFQNGFSIATQTGGDLKDEAWPASLACIVIDKQVARNGQRRTKQCQKAFDDYCASTYM